MHSIHSNYLSATQRSHYRRWRSHWGFRPHQVNFSTTSSWIISQCFYVSALISVEASRVAEMEVVREKREPSPQFFYPPTPFGYQPYYDISPSFEKNVQRPSPSIMPYGPYVAPQQLPTDQRLFFNVYVVTTVTTVSTSTSTSRPACSSSSNFNQC